MERVGEEDFAGNAIRTEAQGKIRPNLANDKRTKWTKPPTLQAISELIKPMIFVSALNLPEDRERRCV